MEQLLPSIKRKRHSEKILSLDVEHHLDWILELLAKFLKTSLTYNEFCLQDPFIHIDLEHINRFNLKQIENVLGDSPKPNKDGGVFYLLINRYFVIKNKNESRLCEIRESTIAGAGSGVFAKIKIPKNTLIGIYIGLYTKSRGRDLLSKYVWKVGKSDYIDAKKITSCMMRYVNDNHDKKAINCEAVYHEDVDISICLHYISCKDININDEIFVAYGEDFWKP